MRADMWQWIDRWPALQAEIDGEHAKVETVWHWGRPSTQEEYLRYRQVLDELLTPEARRRRINLMTTRILPRKPH